MYKNERLHKDDFQKDPIDGVFFYFFKHFDHLIRFFLIRLIKKLSGMQHADNKKCLNYKKSIKIS